MAVVIPFFLGGTTRFRHHIFDRDQMISFDYLALKTFEPLDHSCFFWGWNLRVIPILHRKDPLKISLRGLV